jgi:hypothetical protein
MIRIIILLMCTLAASAQTLIVDRIYSPLNGTLYEGRIQITAPDMTHLGRTYVRSTREYVVTAGNFAASLVPNDAALPAGTSYSVRFVPNSGSPWTQTWVIPTSASPLKINQVRVNTPPSTSLLVLLQQLSIEGATEGSCIKFTGGAPRWVSDCSSPTPTGKTWAQLTTFTWASLSTTTWSQLQ